MICVGGRVSYRNPLRAASTAAALCTGSAPLAPLLLATCVAAGWRVGSPTEVGERERTEEEGDVASQVEAQERGLATTLPTRLEDAHCACKEEEGAEGG